MKQEIIKQHGNKALLLFFSGWGADSGPFKQLDINGYDTMIVWNYSNDSFNLESLTPYREIAVVAWSFGVIAADCFISKNNGLPITIKVAVNGTTFPVDETRGIPPHIFNGTLDNLDERNLRKFYRRMAGNSAKFTAFVENLSHTPIDELKEQLRYISRQQSDHSVMWDHAFISTEDHIIPFENQKRAWATTSAALHTIDSQHLPDFNSLLSPLLINKKLVAHRFGSCHATYDANAQVQHNIATRLAAMLQPASHPMTILEIGSGTGTLSRKLLSRHDIAKITLLDLNSGNIDGHPVIGADGEIYIKSLPDKSLDCIISASTIQWFNSPITFINECFRVLKSGGKALLSTFGPLTYHELTGLAPTLGFAETDYWRRIIPSGFSESSITEETITLKFDSPIDILRHMKHTGVNSISGNGILAARSIIRAYPRDNNGRCRLTYNPIFINLTKK